MKKRILFLCLLACLIFVGASAVSVVDAAAETNTIVSGECGDNVNYELNVSTGVLRIYGTGAMEDYNTFSTPSPWEREYRSIITKVKVEYGVTTIGRDAFRRANYENLTSVEIAPTITDIGSCAFRGCENLAAITIPNSVTSIGEFAFEGNGLTSITIPESVETIGEAAFSSNPISNIKWGNSLKSIGKYAFDGTDIAELQLPEQIESIGSASFSWCKKLKKVSIPDNCEVGSNAFDGCSDLDSVIVGSDCKIHGGAFQECSSLRDISIGKGSVGVYDDGYDLALGRIFYNCTNLQSILLPDSWGFYGTDGNAYARQFTGCTNLTDIRFSDTNSKYKIIDKVVYSKDGSSLIYYPLTLTAEEYEILDGVTSIAAGAFEGHSYLEHIIIPSSVQEIGSNAFYDCSKLNDVIIPEGIEELGCRIFAFCDSLKTIILPTSLKSIDGDYRNCTSTFMNTVLEVIYGEEGSYAEKWAGTKFQQAIYCSFDPNGGSVGEEKKLVIKSDKYRKLPVPIRTGYDFLGWYTQKDLGVLVTGDTLVSADTSHTLYAHWKLKNKYSYSIDDLTYNFSNSRQGFGYGSSYKIPYSSYTIIFGDTVKAKYFYRYAGLWGGSCYGMASTSGMFNYPGSGLGVKDFNVVASKVKDLKILDKDSTNMTVTELIEAMHLSQCDTPIQNAYRATTNCLEDLYEQVNEVRETGKPVLIGVFGPQGGHALLGYDIEKVSDTEAHLYVYDCNFPNQNRYITLSMNLAGEITGWYYHLNDLWHWGSEYADCKINYVTYDNYYSEWENRAMKQTNNILFLNSENVAIYDYNGNLVAILENGELISDNRDIYVVEKMEISADSTRTEQVGVMICLPSDMYTLKNNDRNRTEEFQVSMVGIDRGATVSTSSDEVTFTVNDESEMNSVSIKTSSGDTYNIVLDSTDEIDDAQVEVSGISIGNVVDVSQIKGNLNLNNCIGASISVNGKDITVPEKEKKSVSLDKTTATILKKTTLQLKAIINTSSSSDTLTWSSSNTKVATVDKNGKVTAVKKGTATITVKLASGEKAECKVIVNEIVSSKVALNKKKVTINKGKTLNLKATMSPENSTDDLIWSSSKKKVAKVDKNGKVTALKKGTTTITVKTSSGKKVSCKITVKEIKSTKVSLNKKKLTLKKNKTFTLKAAMEPKNTTDNLTWKSSNPKVASVTAKGKVKALKTGTVIITVKTSSGKKVTCKITVK